jgi:putative membrane protein
LGVRHPGGLTIFIALKVTHILFVVAWMSCLFVLPRVILHWRKICYSSQESEAFKSLSIGLFRFGSLMAILAIFFGIWLWKAFSFNGAWLHYKMAFVFLLIIYHLISGKLLLNIIKNKPFKSNIALRLFNESSLLIIIPIIYFVVSKNA